MIKLTCDSGMGQKTKDVTEMHSTSERLSSYWQRINKFLHLPFEGDIGSLTNKQQQLITTLEVTRIGGSSTGPL